MSQALAWGAIASSSLLFGALWCMWRPLGMKALGLVMAFGAGVLISAVAYELVADALRTGDRFWPIAAGLGLGAVTYYLGDMVIDRMGAADRKRSDAGMSPPFPLVLGIVLDGIPESAVIGVTLLAGTGVSVAMLAAVFLSNLPEAIAATTGLLSSGRSRTWVLTLWASIIVVSAIASCAGYVLLGDASATTYSIVLAFAAGALLTMLADTMMPEAFEHGGSAVGLFTTLGFALAVAIAAIEQTS